jgi:hypothetical protein
MFETVGLPTIVITMSPYWVEQYGAPRALAVEFPFAHPIGPVDDPAMQTRVLREALTVLADAKCPNTIVESAEKWPGDEREWRRLWQPTEASPLIAKYLEQIRAMRPPQRPAG